MKTLSKALTVTENALAKLSIGYLFFVVATITFDVIGRRFIGSSLPWIVEVAEYFLLFSAFMCSGWVLREKGHIVVDFIDNSLSEQGLKRLRVGAYAITFVTTLYILWFTSKLAWIYLERGSYEGNFVHVPQWIVYAPVPIGMALFLLELIRQFTWFLREAE